MYSIYTIESVQIFGEWTVSEVEKVDKVLGGERHSATLGVVGCARVVCVLRKRNKDNDKC